MRTPTEKLIIISIACFLSAFVSQPVLAQKSKTIYHKDWIDLNKNGKKDIYETPTAPIEARIADLLSQMTVEEKTCHMDIRESLKTNCPLLPGNRSYGKMALPISMNISMGL